MTVHPLHAGDGYTYLTRQVATGDHTRTRGQGLTDYYTVDGNPPGVWGGRGAEVLGVSGVVSEEQMKALFGEGLHPDADRMQAELVAQGMSAKDAVEATRLGRRFMKPEESDDGWRAAVGAAYDAFRKDNGRDPEVGVERDLIRWNVATAMLQEQLSRAPQDAEVSTFLAERGKQGRQPVAGYDLVFTPSKSVSVLWGVTDEETSWQVREAHEAAWRSTMEWLDQEAALTRIGAGGIAQIETNGLTWTAFDHHDSRTGDPNLHTHVAVSTKVQGVDGKWRSLDGRVLHQLGVAASERYNSRIEQELRQRLEVTFVDEPRGRNKRPVREIAGVPKEVRDAFSSRRRSIDDAYEQLVKDYVASHGHSPNRAVQLKLAQQATLDTRDAKAAPKKLSEQRVEWREQAARVIGDKRLAGLAETVRKAHEFTPKEATRRATLAAMSTSELAAGVLTVVEQNYSTWQFNIVLAEAERLAVRVAAVRPVDVNDLAAELTTVALERCVKVTAPELNPVPEQLRRSDGISLYEQHRGARYTSLTVLRNEDRLLQAAETKVGFRVAGDVFDAALKRVQDASDHPLDAGQIELARRFACEGVQLSVGIGPAGTGKTTSMRVFARAVEAAGGRVLALAPSAVASTVLAEEIDVEADTAHKLIQIHTEGSAEQRQSDRYRLDNRTILLIDEAGMADTHLLAGILELAEKHGCQIRLLGDPAQLTSVQAGGALRLIEKRTKASYLDTVHRFINKTEAAATLKLRVGNPAGLDFYLEHNRTRGGLRQTMLEDIYTAWSTDRETLTEKGKPCVSIMIAGTNEEVAALNHRARTDLITAGHVDPSVRVQLHDGNHVSTGDTIVTRENHRRLRMNRGKDFVANSDLWTVLATTPDGALKVKSLRHGGIVTLPASYVADHVELGYAATINRVQGMTVDTTHVLLDPDQNTREQLYVALTRGRANNRAYVVSEELDVDGTGHVHDHIGTSIRHALTRILDREGAELSAHETIQVELDRSMSLAKLLPEYDDARTRIMDPDIAERMAAVVRQHAGADVAGRLTGDPAWGRLAARLDGHQATGTELGPLIGSLARPNDLAEDSTIESLAKVYHHRLGAAEQTGHQLPAWVAPPPPADGPNPQLRGWLHQQADLITDRIEHLIDDTITTRPAWSRTLGVDGLDEASRRDLGTVVAYRDLNQITDPARPLGERPEYDTAATQAATAAWARLRNAASAVHVETSTAQPIRVAAPLPDSDDDPVVVDRVPAPGGIREFLAEQQNAAGGAPGNEAVEPNALERLRRLQGQPDAVPDGDLSRRQEEHTKGRPLS